MKDLVVSVVLGLGLLASGCGVFDVYRDQQMPAPRSSETHGRQAAPQMPPEADRKSTRLNSSHGYISYAVFCLKKKKCSDPTWRCRDGSGSRGPGTRTRPVTRAG